MDRQLIAKTWVHFGLTDLYFAFDSDGVAFSDNVLFSEIMGMEKFIKAVLLFNLHHEYERLTQTDAKKRIDELAKRMGHNFEKMLKDLLPFMSDDIDRISKTDFDGYIGSDLIQAVRAGYMETRYPVPELISDKFPINEISINDTEITHDPLWSSGITKFIYAVCNACYAWLLQHIDFNDLINQHCQFLAHKESFQRFNNLFWEKRCKTNM